MKGYGVSFQRIEAGAYIAVDEDKNEVGSVYRDRFGVWRAQVVAPTGEEPPYRAELCGTLKWAKRFIMSNAAKT